MILGRGALGRALARALRAAGRAPRLLSGRGVRSAALKGVQLVILAVPDAALREVAEALAPELPRGCVVLHCAGARTTQELSALTPAGVSTGVLHPLVSFVRGARAELRGAAMVATGDRRALARARWLTRAVGARLVVAAPGVHGPRYHAAAALAANGAVGLAWAARALFVEQGLAPREADHALASLLSSVAHNLQQVGLPGALSGPILRGDAPAVRAHRAALRDAPIAASAYAGVAPAVLDCARAAGLGRAEARQVTAALRAPVTPRRRGG